MPSPEHELLVELFRSRPQLSVEAVTEFLGLPLPPFTTIEPVDSEAGQSQPVEARADLVHLVKDGDHAVHALAIEVQRRVDPAKLRSWPLYAATLGGRHGCPSDVLVVTPSRKVARWASKPIPTGLTSTFRPLVLGPDDVPRLADPSAEPELLLLSAAAHARGPSDRDMVQALVEMLTRVDESKRPAYHAGTLVLLNPRLRKEYLMLNERVIPLSDWARGHYFKGHEKGRAEGRSEGLAEGRSEGRVEGRAGLLALMLQRRFGPLSPETTNRLHTADESTLLHWGERFVDAQTLDDVFAED